MKELETYHILIIMAVISWGIFNIVYDALYNVGWVPHEREFYFGIIYGSAVAIGAYALSKYNERNP